ncbi:hypothetical protein MKX03_008950 [Papaver bracteatum]|nr:hypothetical protein MKX03_008950 [Papaver bracteatum]
MASVVQLRFSPQSNPHDLAGNSQFSTRTSSRLPSLPLSSPSNISFNSRSPANLSLSLLQSKSSKPKLSVNAELSADTGGNSGSGIGNHNTGGDGNNGGGGDSGRRNNDGDGNSDNQSSASSFNGRNRRCVSACVLGDMASRPNFGLNELDFVFSTLVVRSILNFVLMYLLAPTMGSTSSSLPAMFASCPQSHMFEPGMFTLLDRFGTFVYKGAVFAAVGFAAGLVGTAISNGLILMRNEMDPNFETPNKPPPTLLNAMTWAIHMGLSSNFRYQTLNGSEFLLAKGLPPVVFKGSVVVLRCMNNVLGGVSFVTLARLTGSLKVEGKPVVSIKKGVEEETGTAEKKG